jgi:PII-like signaling protein
MPLKYSVIEIFTSEEVRFDGKQIQDAVVQYVRDLKIAARCIVTRGIQGCYESGEIAAHKILDLSYHMPLKIEVVLPSPELENILPEIENIVGEGIIGLREMEISVYKTNKHLFPRHLKVKDIMTVTPQTVTSDTTLHEVAKILLSSIFTGIPIVDSENRPSASLPRVILSIAVDYPCGWAFFRFAILRFYPMLLSLLFPDRPKKSCHSLPPASMKINLPQMP